MTAQQEAPRDGKSYQLPDKKEDGGARLRAIGAIGLNAKTVELWATGLDLIHAPGFEHILDLGCGPGAALPVLLEASDYVTGIDINGDYLEAAKGAARKAGVGVVGDMPVEGITPRVVFHQLRIEDIANHPDILPHGTFDAVEVRLTFQHLSPEEIEQGMDAIRKLLKPNGLIFFEDFTIAEDMRLSEETPAWVRLKQAFMDMYDKNGTSRLIGRQFAALAQRHGFETLYNDAYQLESATPFPEKGLKSQTLQTFESARKSIVENEILTDQEFTTLMAQLTEDFQRPDITAFSAPIHQVIARKPAA